MLTRSLPERHVSEFAADVRDSLTKREQRELPSKYLYDEVGSALFETICLLPSNRQSATFCWIERTANSSLLPNGIASASDWRDALTRAAIVSSDA